MRPQSAKAKGRRAQQLVRDALRIVGAEFRLADGDFESTSMGAPGVDVKFSPAAERAFGAWATEVKNVEKLDVHKVFSEHAAKYPGKLPVLIHTKNRADVLVTMKFELWLSLLREVGLLSQGAEQGAGFGPQHNERNALTRAVAGSYASRSVAVGSITFGGGSGTSQSFTAARAAAPGESLDRQPERRREGGLLCNSDF